jgi:hypothetical protein
MMEEKSYTLDEAHLQFAKQANGTVWGLLDKKDRSPAEDGKMLHAAHASLFHWLHAGTALHHQRGEWLISRVHSVLGNGQEALRHAERCADLTRENADLMEDFDKAFALEAVARAHAVLGNRELAAKHIKLARKAGEAVADEENRSIFVQDFEGGDWHGLM